MKIIHKHILSASDAVQEIEMPHGSEIIGCQLIGGLIYMFVLSDTSKPKEFKSFCVYGTDPLNTSGGHIPDNICRSNFIGTFQVPKIDRSGVSVYHIFQL